MCGAIRYQLAGEPEVVAICHCSAGAPKVTWAMFPEAALTVTQGEPRTINSSGSAMRSFCGDCGTALFYCNTAILPGIVDIHSSTLDDRGALPPSLQIQTAERLSWVKQLHALPEFERFPE